MGAGGISASLYTFYQIYQNDFNPKFCNTFPISNLHIHDILQLFGWQAIAQRVEKIYFLWHKLSASAYISLEMFHKFMLDYFNYFYSNFVEFGVWLNSG